MIVLSLVDVVRPSIITYDDSHAYLYPVCKSQQKLTTSLNFTRSLSSSHLIVGITYVQIIIITSQGGSVSWRTTQNPDGGDYGHHMSKSAANMMAMLMSQEMKKDGIAVGIFHPGFNKTGMTKKYEKIWEIEGAVDASVGAKRVFHEVIGLTMETTGKFINCEDGLEIPW